MRAVKILCVKLMALSLLSFTASCRTENSTATVKDALADVPNPEPSNEMSPPQESQQTVAAIDCGDGEYQTFTFQPVFFNPRRKLVLYPGMPVPPPSLFKLEVSDQSEQRVRLDTCFIDGTEPKLDLRRVIYKNSSSSAYTEYPVTANSVVEGLKEAVFDDNQAKIKIQIAKPGTTSDQYLVIYGWKQSHDTFATVGEATIKGGKVASNQTNLLTGKLGAGDPIAADKCPFGKTFVAKTFKFGTATFAAQICIAQAPGETVGYTFEALRITDSNEALSVAARAPVELGKEQIAAVMKYAWNHHNTCDSFYIKLGEVEYAATTAPAVGCGTIVENAPPRQLNDTDGKVHYRVRYHGGPWQEEKSNCRHFLSPETIVCS